MSKPIEQLLEIERQCEQQAREYLNLLQPLIQELGMQAELSLSRSEAHSAAHYKSTLDVRFVDAHGQVLWLDSLILAIQGELWAGVEDVLPFLQGAFREALRSWRKKYGK